jgi:hypothetical protein
VQEVLLTTAGMAVVKSASSPKSTTYSPISASIPSATMYGWIVDKKRALTGGRGNVTGLTMKIGDRFKGHLQFQGNYAFSEVTLPSVTTYGNVPAVSTAANSTLTVNCASASVSNLVVWGKQLSIDFGNQLATSEYTSKKVNRITDRNGTFTAIFARTALADFNPWAIRDAGYIVTFAYKLNETATLSTTLNVRCQLENITEQALDNGDSGWQITGPCIASSAGGDEFSIVFLDSTP